MAQYLVAISKLLVMKKFVLLLLVTATLLSACENEEEGEDIVQPVLFEYAYVNHAWVYTHHGWLIDQNGVVKGFQLPDSWNFADEDGYISKDDLKENLAQTDTVYHTVDKDKMLRYFDDRLSVVNGRIDTSDTMMADAGISALYVYVWDSQKDLYKKQLLKSKGDLQMTNVHYKVKSIVSWLEEVGEKTDRFYWGF
jgi:hypothetical protein